MEWNYSERKLNLTGHIYIEDFEGGVKRNMRTSEAYKSFPRLPGSPSRPAQHKADPEERFSTTVIKRHFSRGKRRS